jgi:hypothetical protein
MRATYKLLVGRIFLAGFLFTPLLFSSCYKIESGSYIYSPTYSLPVGSMSLTFADVVSKINLYPAPDDTTRIDSIPVLLYNDNLFYTSRTFDSTAIQFINFQALENDLGRTVEIVFRINYANFLPTPVAGQVYFQDAADFVIDSLMSDGYYLVDAAQVDPNGVVVEPTVDRVEIPFSGEKIDMLNRVQSIAIHTRMQLVPENNGVNKFYSDQRFEVQIGLRVSVQQEISR